MVLPTICRWTGALGPFATDWGTAIANVTNWVNTLDNGTNFTPSAGNDAARFDKGISVTGSGHGRAYVIEIVEGAAVTITGNIDAGSLIEITSPFSHLTTSPLGESNSIGV